MHPKSIFNTELENWFLELFDQYLLAKENFMSVKAVKMSRRGGGKIPRPTLSDIGNLRVKLFWEEIFNQLNPRDFAILLSLYDNNYTPTVALQNTMVDFGFHRVRQLEKHVEKIFLEVYVIFQKRKGARIYE